MVRITVAIVTYRSKAELPNCLDSLLKSDVALKVVVIDNASGDGTVELVKEYAVRHSNVTVVESNKNIGLAAANNLVMPHIEGDYVLILNPDTVLTPTTLSSLLQVMDNDHAVGVAGPKNVYESGAPHTSYHHGWGFGHLILWRVFPYSLMRKLYDTHAKYREAEVHYVSGACLMVRSRVFEEIGGYDPAYFLTAEDTCDLCRRIRSRGFTVRYCPQATVTHLTGRSGRQTPFLAVIEGYKGSIYYFRKYHGPLGGGLAFTIIVFACLMRLVTLVPRLVLPGAAACRTNLRMHWIILLRLLSDGPDIVYSHER